MALQVRRGLKVNLPATAPDGQLLLTEDTHELYAGTGASVVPIASTGAAPSMIYPRISTADDNRDVIQASPGTVTGWSIFNDAGYPVYVKLYDQDTAPNPAADTVKATIGVQAGQPSEIGLTSPLSFVVGIGIAIVKGITNTDDTPVSLNDCSVNIFFN